MAVTFWWLGLLVLAALVGILVWRLTRTQGRQTDDGVLAANTDRLRQTPRFRELARRYLLWLAVQLACVVLAALGSVLLVSRVSSVQTIEPETRNRDIVLCLDVSGSMTAIDAELMKGYQTITDGLKNERVALVIFDSSAATVFPLTNDYGFVHDELVRGEQALRKRDWDWRAGTTSGRDSSLIPDGLMSCLERFDQLDRKRPRTLVIATDNMAGKSSIFTMEDGVQVALERGVMIYAIAPELWKDSKQLQELESVAKRTGGGLTSVKESGSSQKIIDAVTSKESQTFKGAPQKVVNDEPLVGATLLALGVAGAVLAAWRMRR